MVEDAYYQVVVELAEKQQAEYEALRAASLSANLEQEKMIAALQAERDDLAAKLAQVLAELAEWRKAG